MENEIDPEEPWFVVHSEARALLGLLEEWARPRRSRARIAGDMQAALNRMLVAGSLPPTQMKYLDEEGTKRFTRAVHGVYNSVGRQRSSFELPAALVGIREEFTQRGSEQ